MTTETYHNRLDAARNNFARAPETPIVSATARLMAPIILAARQAVAADPALAVFSIYLKYLIAIYLQLAAALMGGLLHEELMR